MAMRMASAPPGFVLRTVLAGYLCSSSAGLRGRAMSSPPQFGHLPASTAPAQPRQNVHSNEQINASADSGGRSRSQHSQLGRISSIGVSKVAGRQALLPVIVVNFSLRPEHLPQVSIATRPGDYDDLLGVRILARLHVTQCR